MWDWLDWERLGQQREGGRQPEWLEAVETTAITLSLFSLGSSLLASVCFPEPKAGRHEEWAREVGT